MQVVDSEGYLKVKLVGGPVGPFVPYTGATGNVDLGTHSLTARNIIVNHPSGSGVAVSITKGGSGEALTVVKTSGSGNAMSVTGGNVEFGTGFFWDSNNNRLGIGTSSPAFPLDVLGTAKFASATSGMIIRDWTAFNTFRAIYKASETPSNTNYLMAFDTDVLLNSRGSGTDIYYNGSIRARFGNAFALRVIGSGTTTATVGMEVTSSANTNLFQIRDNGAVLINTTTDAGFKLDVNGTARVQTSLEIAGATGLTLGGGASALAYSGNILNIGNSASWGDVRLFAGGVQKFSQTSSLTTISNTTINLSTATVQLAGVNALTYSGTDIRIGSVAAGFNSLSMYVAGSERARIASTGNLLINTTTDAGFKLDVNGTARVVATHQIYRDNQLGSIDLNLYNGQAGWQGGMHYFTGAGGSGQRLTFYAGGVLGTNDRMSIFSDGNVCVNTTTNSGFKFDVNGTARVQGALTIANGLLRIDNTGIGGNATFNFLGTSAFFDSAFALNIGTNSNGGAYSNGVVQIWNKSNLNNLLVLYDGVNIVNERLRVTKGGNLLINTTTDAGFRLDVNGTARVATSILVGPSSTQGTIQTGVFRGTFFNDYANNFTIFQVQTSGNVSFYNSVAIGTTSAPSASKLRVVGLPTSPVGLSAGDVWNNLGILTIV